MTELNIIDAIGRRIVLEKRAGYLLSYKTEIKDSKKREKELAEEMSKTYLITGGH